MVVLHELQVIAVPRGGGVFSWKKVSRAFRLVSASTWWENNVMFPHDTVGALCHRSGWTKKEAGAIPLTFLLNRRARLPTEHSVSP